MSKSTSMKLKIPKVIESEDAQEGGWIVLQKKQYKIKTLTQILLYWFGLTLDLRPVLNPLIEFH